MRVKILKMEIKIKEVSPTDDNVKELFKLLDAHNMSYCPPDVCHLTQPDELESVSSILLGVFCDEMLCGMGGLKFYDEYAEVTRIFVKDKCRGHGLADKIINELEKEAIKRDLMTLRLETSDKFERAYQLYIKHGFKLCEAFGEYVDKPYNTYMQKMITLN